MLKKTRIILAIVSLSAFILLFTDFTGETRNWCGWLAKIQLIPALLSMSIAAIVFITALTFIFGRLYCSVICPLGIFQDIIIRLRNLSGFTKKRHNRFNYKKNAVLTRSSILVLFVILALLGITNTVCASLAGLIDPYSAFGRIATAFAVPVWDFINNFITDNTDSYTFYFVYRTTSWLILGVATITLVVIITFAWFTGRDYCNKICPVGTILGYISKYSLFKPVIDTTKCNGCTKCARNCKASCIDAHNHAIDYTRCVACFNCLQNCSQGAISYISRVKRTKTDDYTPADTSRRNFLTTAGIITGTLALKATTDKSLTTLKEKRLPDRATRVVPPGALSIANLTEHCTGCQLCISACPNGVLSPSTSLHTLMQPDMNFTNGYCRPECAECSSACPTGAITPIDIITKSSTQIGRAVVNIHTCISASEGISCGNCARHCPSGAIIMVEIDGEGSNLRPSVDETRCIGCGSCEYHCPVGRVDNTPDNTPAIHVEGIEEHHTI